MHKPTLITIDGAAGTGKSTLGELLAQRLQYLYFDTGVMYRAVTLVALQQELDCTDPQAMETLAHQTTIDVLPPNSDDGRQYTVLVNGEDVTWQLRDSTVERHVSLVAKHPKVREELIRQQRRIGKRGNVVMVGRDIGTIVATDAPLKIYLETSLEERARRRFLNEQTRGNTAASLEQIQADLARRDTLDEHVLYPAQDALILQTDTISPSESVEWIIAKFETIPS